MDRDLMVERAFVSSRLWDLVIIGGGATGVGIAVDAASRGYDVCLVEQSDFGKGTSSRSTKLIHGGVRYLQQGNISLVTGALRERGILRQNAPHLVSDREFIVPNYAWWEIPYYGIGLKLYDLLAGRYGFRSSRWLSSAEAKQRLPNLKDEALRGGISYSDGQFDDARLLVSLAQTAVEQGATLINYCTCTQLLKDSSGQVEGVRISDLESGRECSLRAKAVVNATGCFTDQVLRMDEPKKAPIIAPSQGIHLVLPGDFLAGDSALMVPRTTDGRVLFAIPWHNCTVIGTTDTPISDVELEPLPLKEEVEFILDTARSYLSRPPRRQDVLSVFTGIRPLVKAQEGQHTASLSRDHTLFTSTSKLITIAGGKWTTYRKMAQTAVDLAIKIGELKPTQCKTQHLNIHGYHASPEKFGEWAYYGADAQKLLAMGRAQPDLQAKIHPDLSISEVQVLWAVEQEMARTVDDVLSRRTRALLLNARAAIESAPKVAHIMAASLGKDSSWVAREIQSFNEMAQAYLLEPYALPAEVSVAV